VQSTEKVEKNMKRLIAEKTHFLFMAIAIILLTFSQIVKAAPDDQEELTEGRAVIGRAGELLVLQYTPGTGTFTLKAAGNPIATIDSSQVATMIPGDESASKVSSFEIPAQEGLDQIDVQVKGGKIIDVNQ
jgi:hypothetical protein